MHRREIIIAIATEATLLFSAQPAVAADQKNLALFGINLKGGSRDQLRQAFKQNGLRVIREENNYWVDTYDATGILDGASNFEAGYVSATGKFAYAQYTFHAFKETQLVEKVINMVAIKYGKPTSQSGSGLGDVTAKWNMVQGMLIEVSGWPDTTTYLKFIDASANNQMAAEIDAEKKSQITQKAKSQSKAF